MSTEHIALVLDEIGLTIDELAVSCAVSREWVIEHVHSGVLTARSASSGTDPAHWVFGGRDLMRSRRMFEVERQFDANPELAGLVVDLCDEVERLRARLRSAGLSSE